MGLRQTINEKPIIPILGLGLLIALILGYFLFFRDTGNYGGTDRVYVSTDDGATFQDYATGGELPPYQIGGKEAVRAYVYEDRTTGERFVGYLLTYPPDRQSGGGGAAGDGPPGGLGGRESGPPALVKRPGDAEWVDAADAQNAEKVRDIRGVYESPAGNKVITLTPDVADNAG